MCRGCWEEYGSPEIKTEATRAAAKLAERVYEFSCVGGNLHIVLDDWNIEDENIAWCRERINRIRSGTIEQYDDTDPQQLEAEDACLKALEPMTLEERASALAIWDQFVQ